MAGGRGILRALGRLNRGQQRQENREDRQEIRQMGREERAQLKQELKNLPLKQKLALAQAMARVEDNDQDEGAGMMSRPGLPYAVGVPQRQTTEQLRGSPVGGRAPYGLGRVTTTVPAGSTGTISQLPTLISPSFFRPGRLIVTPRALPAGVTGYVTALNIGTINQLASLGESGFEAYDPLLEGGEIDIADIPFGIPVQLVGVLTNSTAGPIDVSWGATMYGERLG